MLREPDRLSVLITAVRRRWFLNVALRTAGLALAAAAIPVLAAAGVYWLLSPAGDGLLVLAGATAILASGGAALVLLRMPRRPDDRRVARFIEECAERIPGQRSMDDCVVTAVQASASGSDAGRTPLAGLVLGAALRRLQGLNAAALVPTSMLRRSGAIASGGAGLLILALIAGSAGLRHAYETARLRLFPGLIAVEVRPGDLRIVAGRPLTITARIHAEGVRLARSTPDLVVTAGEESTTVPMVPTDEGYEFRLESVDRTFSYTVTAGAVASDVYTVTALFPPRVERIEVQYRYPAFSGLSPRAEADGGDIYAPVGTRVRVAIHASKPIAAGELAMSRGASVLAAASGRVGEADLVLAKDDSYRVRLTDRDGLTSEGESEYFIRLMDDRPPDVRILRPAGDQGITPLEEVAIEARAEDDYGVASLDLVYAVGGGEARRVPFTATTGGNTQRTGTRLLAAEDLKVKPGDVITYYAVARDVGRGKRPSEARSDLFFLEVRPFNEEFVAAQSQGGGAAGGGDQQLESLIQAQKEIISATWNIERRSGGGRSAADIRAVAEAQAELKARAERMLRRGGGPSGRDFAPQQITRPPRPALPTDGVAAAVGAMTLAVEQLASERTTEAIPHEMAALNGLLQAQAEVRRREVQQANSNAGSRGGNRQAQDLSALFDRELQRQQRTNYEQRPSVEERPAQAQDDRDALDRIRDLAGRQEALNERQRALERLSAEQRRRELEKLTRDQEELQRRAEALSKAMQPGKGEPRGGRQGQAGQPGQRPDRQQDESQKGEQGSAGVRSAAEQMRRAAGDMQRGEGQSAAQSGERAASELRRLEQQMQGGSAEARARAAADLQAEAQQIAQEQRRIAGEAARLEGAAATGTADARRRLAADKDRLAERVEALERGAQRLGTAPGKGPEQARARAAAGQLASERVGEKMRAGAREMRAGTTAPSGGAEQQIANGLERVVEKLGGGASTEARALAGELDRSRNIRETLDRLEAQMREAQGRGDGQAGRLRQQYEQELRRTRDALAKEDRGARRDGRGGSTPENQERSGSAPGTEAFKQDRSGWEPLRNGVDRALAERDAAVSRRLAKALGEDQLHAGGSQHVPEAYRDLVAKYYESLARVKK